MNIPKKILEDIAEESITFRRFLVDSFANSRLTLESILADVSNQSSLVGDKIALIKYLRSNYSNSRAIELMEIATGEKNSPGNGLGISLAKRFVEKYYF